MAGILNRDEMERVIREGGSVLYKGVIITRIVDLPHAAALAQGDARQTEAVRAALDAQMAALALQRAQLDAATPQMAASAATEETGTQERADGPPARPPAKRS